MDGLGIPRTTTIIGCDVLRSWGFLAQICTTGNPFHHLIPPFTRDILSTSGNKGKASKKSLSSWWFQPNRKNSLVKLDHLPQIGVIFFFKVKPPPSPTARHAQSRLASNSPMAPAMSAWRRRKSNAETLFFVRGSKCFTKQWTNNAKKKQNKEVWQWGKKNTYFPLKLVVK